MSTPLNSQAALAPTGKPDSEGAEPMGSRSASIGSLMPESQTADSQRESSTPTMSPPCRRDLMLAARAAAKELFLIPVEAIHDDGSMQAFLKTALTDFQLLSLMLLKSRIPRKQLQAQHPDVLRALEQADVITPP